MGDNSVTLIKSCLNMKLLSKMGLKPKAIKLNSKDIPMEFIEKCLDTALATGDDGILPGETRFTTEKNLKVELIGVYFAGATCCFDIRVNRKSNVKTETITLSWYEQTFGLFSGGKRFLLEIPTLNKLTELMKKHGIKLYFERKNSK